MPEETPLLQLKNVTQRFGGLVAVSNVDYIVDKGRIDSLIGPNGAGKTTVFNAVTGIVEPTSGEIEFEGEDIRLPFGPGVVITCLCVGLATAIVCALLSLDINQLWKATVTRPLTVPGAEYSLAVGWEAAVSNFRGELAVNRQQLGAWAVTRASGKGDDFAVVDDYETALKVRNDLEELVTSGPPPAIVPEGKRFVIRSLDGQRTLFSASTQKLAEYKWSQLSDYAAARIWTPTYFALAFAFGLILGTAASFAVWWQSRRTPDVIARRGIARTFQNIRLFKDMTVLENVLVSLDQRKTATAGWLFWLSYLSWADASDLDEARKLLQFVGLGEKSSTETTRQSMLAKNLPYGDQRRLEIARALALAPKLILLDEPAAGMNPAESLDLLWLIRAIRDLKVTVLLIEHHMRVVMDISDFIGVLHQGVKIASGTPAEIRSNPAVIEAYLGSEEVT